MLQGGVVLYRSGTGYGWAIPKVYTTGTGWQTAVPLIYNGSSWEIVGRAGCPMITLIDSNTDNFIDANGATFSIREM